MKRYKIIDKRPEATPEMLDKAMDFEGLMSGHKATGSSSFKLLKSLAVTGILLLTGYLSIVYFFIRDNEVENSAVEEAIIPPKSEESEAEVIEGIIDERKETVAPITVESVADNVDKEVGVNDEAKANRNNEVDQKEDLSQEKVENLEQQKEALPVYEEKSNYDYLEAEPVDGITALYAYFDNTLKYPESALPDSIQGVTLVTFTINVEGRAEGIIIEKSLGVPFDNEAIRLIEGMPIWRPASINGQSINSKVSIPLTFRIEE